MTKRRAIAAFEVFAMYLLTGAGCITIGSSMLLAKCMQELQRHSYIKFELKFLVMDPGYNPENRRRIEENLALLGIPVTFFTTDIFDVVNTITEKPCYLCARMTGGGAVPPKRCCAACGKRTRKLTSTFFAACTTSI